MTRDLLDVHGQELDQRDPLTASAPARTSRLSTPRVTVAIVLALFVWAGVIVISRAWGLRLMDDGVRIILFTPPVLGGYRTSIPSGLWLPVAVAVLGVAVLPSVARRLSWSLAVAATTAMAGGWWLSLALVDGTRGLTRGLVWNEDYAAIAPRAGQDPLGVIRNYVAELPQQPIQVRGHPPGFVLVAGWLDWLGLPGPGWATALVLIVGLTSIPALAVGLRSVADEPAARAALPFIALSPAALWLATSVDAFFVGVTAWSVALVLLAMHAEGRRRDVLAVFAGLLGGFALLLSYGLVLMAFVPLFVAWSRHRWREVLVAGGVALVVVLAMVPLGFWWIEGLLATKLEYDTLDLERPYNYFLVNNVGALALALGPAVAVGLVVLRDRRVWLLVGGALCAVIVANLSGLSEGEVERIWLPFAVWIGLAALAAATGRTAMRLCLSAQAVTAIGVIAWIETYW